MPRYYKIRIRRDVAADWESSNPILADGELGYERDTTSLKVGDGSTPWNDLGYLTFASELYPLFENKIRIVGEGGEETPGASSADSEILLELVSGQFGAIRNLFMIRDYLNAPILWVANAGGLKITDNIEFKDGSLNNLIRFCFMDASERTLPGIVFGADSAASGDYDAGMGTHIRRDEAAGVAGIYVRTGGSDVMRFALGNAYWIANGTLKQLGAPVDRRDAARYGDLTPNPAVILCGAGSTNLTTSLAVPTNHSAVVDYADFTVPTDCKLQVRLRAKFGTTGTGTLSDGDVLEAEFYDNVSSSIKIANTTLTTANIGGSPYAQQIVTAWTDVANTVTGAAAWRGAPRVRNATGARGNIQVCQLEFRFTQA